MKKRTGNANEYNLEFSAVHSGAESVLGSAVHDAAGAQCAELYNCI